MHHLSHGLKGTALQDNLAAQKKSQIRSICAHTLNRAAIESVLQRHLASTVPPIRADSCSEADEKLCFDNSSIFFARGAVASGHRGESLTPLSLKTFAGVQVSPVIKAATKRRTALSPAR